MREYQGEITTIGGLDRYVRWWNAKVDDDAPNCVFSLSRLNGMHAVRREWNSFGRANEARPSHLEIFSLPLDEETFLDVGFKMQETVGGRTDKWKMKAEEMAEAIKSTVVLEPAQSRAIVAVPK